MYIKLSKTTIRIITSLNKLFCLAEQRNSCLSKKLVFINIYLYIYMLERLSGLKEKEYMYMLQVLYFKFN